MTATGQAAAWTGVRQGQCVPIADVPLVSPEEFAIQVCSARQRGGRLAQLFGRRMPDGTVTVYAFVAYDGAGSIQVCAMQPRQRTAGDAPAFPSLTATWPAAQAFEREIAEQYGLRPLGHPWLRPLRGHAVDSDREPPWGPLEPQAAPQGDQAFYRVRGAEVHEVAVGPVHAGVIEPGHFRFQCHGEEVLHLEIALGYEHRGVEPLLVHPHAARALAAAETIAGDASIGHALAHCAALEALADAAVGARAQAIRGIALELERLANHVGDLGALCNDVAFLPGAAYLGRLRGEFLNLTLEICGNRFGRNLVRPGGVRFDVSDDLGRALRSRLEDLQTQVRQVLEMMFAQSSVLARFEGTGALTEQLADEIGLVGPAARACGCARDVRQDHPYGVYQFTHIPLAVETTGDVYARAVVRWLEVQRSLEFLLEQLPNLPGGKTFEPLGSLQPDALAVGLAETWRGEALHVAFTDGQGRLEFVKAKDPSLHNWLGLALALRGVPISDFPLCNKSFNLSYAGHDL